MGPRIIHPKEHAAIKGPTTTPPAHAESGPASEAENAPFPSGGVSGAQGATGGADLPMSAVERDLRAQVASLKRERDGMEKRLNETERKLAASWDEQKASTQGLRERCATLEADLDLERNRCAVLAADRARLERERDASRRAEADADRSLEAVRATLIAERVQHEAVSRPSTSPADAHPLIVALMDRMLRVMRMEAGGGACNPHAVVCAALDAAHTFAEEDGTEATARLRDIVRASTRELERATMRMKMREKDALHYHAEWMHARGLADAIADQIGAKAIKRAIKRAEQKVYREGMGRVRDLLREEYDEEDPASDGERDDEPL